MAQFQFDASQHAASLNFDALPKGWYQGVVSESKSRTTNSGGQALDFVVELTAPPFAKGRKVFLGFNVVNSNPEAVRIGYEQLAAFSIACGHPKWNQTEELHNKPLHIKLKIEKAPEGSDYEDRNQPNGYDPITVHRALAVQPGAVGGGAPFPGGAPVALPAAPVAPAAPVVAALVQPAAPVQQAAPAQPWTPPAQPTQPWEQPAAAAAPVAPVTQAPAPVAAEPVKSPEQIAWEAQQAALAAQQQQAQVAPVAPVQPEAPVAAQPAAATPPWATQTASPAPQQAAPAQAAAAPAEPPHPAQAQVPPWQQPQA